MFTTTLDTEIVQFSFKKIKNAFTKGDYRDAIDKATITLSQIHQSQLLGMLDRRAYAFGMKGEFEKAIKDANTMIECGGSSMMAHGYLRLGSLLEMQGKQEAAIQMYQEALGKMATSVDDYSGYKQLVHAKEAAEKKNNYRFDIISALPSELCEEIISYLTEKERSMILLDISATWCRRISNCQKSWAEMLNNYKKRGNEWRHHDMMNARTLPYIARHIKRLTLDTFEEDTLYQYMKHMQDGKYKNLQSLEITERATNYLVDVYTTASLKKSLLNIQNTLTVLSINYRFEYSTLKLSDVLYNCPRLKKFEIISMDSLVDLIDDLEILKEPHLPLVDLTLSLESVSGKDLKKLTKWCPNIRLLLLEGAIPCVIDVVCNEYPKLEVFGYNPGRVIPGLDTFYNKDLNRTSTDTHEEQGLRGIFTCSNGDGVPKEHFIQLLEKSQKTLERLYINMSDIGVQTHNGTGNSDSDPSLARIRARYQCLKFDRLHSLVCECDVLGVFESIVLNSVGPSLKKYGSVYSPKISNITDVLITRPPINYLKISQVDFYTSLHDYERRKLAAQSIIRLFKSYATTSLPGSENRFEKFKCEYKHFMSDPVLDALADITTLKDVYLHSNWEITNEGMKNFLYKLNKNNVQIINFTLANISSAVNDDLLVEIVRNLKSLETLSLCHVTTITVDGIKKLVDGAQGLRHLCIKFCFNADVKDDIISYVKKNRTKVRQFKILAYEDDDDYLEYDIDL